jgi:hypothetical protein
MWQKKHMNLMEEGFRQTDGYTEFWELAERFGVTEEFAKKAVCYYVHGNLASELYF